MQCNKLWQVLLATMPDYSHWWTGVYFLLKWKGSLNHFGQLSLSSEKCVLAFSEDVCSLQVLLESGATTLPQVLEAGRGSLSCLCGVIFLPIARSFHRVAGHPWARGPPVLNRLIHLADSVTSLSITDNQYIQVKKTNQASGHQSV